MILTAVKGVQVMLLILININIMYLLTIHARKQETKFEGSYKLKKHMQRKQLFKLNIINNFTMYVNI